MYRKQNIFIGILLILLATGVNSCKLSKNITNNNNQKKIHPISLKRLNNNINRAYLNYDYLQLKISAKTKTGKTKYSLKGQIRIKKDSIIWINLTHSTGIPVMKMLLLKDSIVFRNNLSSEYYAGNYDFLSKWLKLDLNYYYFQSMLTNELFTYPDYTDVFDLKKGNYKDDIDSNMYCLKSLKNRRIKRQIRKNQVAGLVVQNILINPQSFKIHKVFIEEYDQNRTLEIKYSNFIDIEEKLMPKEINFSIDADTNHFDLKIKYNKIVSNKKLTFPFQIPSKYTRIQ